MKKQKQLLSLVLSAAMVIGLMPVNLTGTKASAAEVGAGDQGETIPDLPKEPQKGTFGPNADEKDRFTWELSTEGVLTIGCTADMTTAESGLPDQTTATVEELPWYEWHAAIKKVVFNGDMSSVGAYNFAVKNKDTGYVSLKEIDITNASKLTVLGQSAFNGCTALDTVTGGKGLDQFTRMGDYAFSNTGFKTLTLSCQTLGNAFRGCEKLTSVTAENLTKIDGVEAFRGCTSLTTVKMDKLQTITAANTFRECTSLQEIHLPALTEIAPPSNLCGGTFRDCAALKTVDLPLLSKVVNDNNISNSGAFSYCTALEKISLPAYKDGDSRAMFYGCTKLSAVDLPKMETNIGTDMFRKCSSLRVLTLPKASGQMNGSSFYGCTSLVGVNTPLSSISGTNFELAEQLTWVCIGGSYSSFHSANSQVWNVSPTNPGGSQLPPRQKVDRVYFSNITDSSVISQTNFSTTNYKKPITFYVTKAIESKIANVAKANNPNITLKVVEDEAAIQKLIEKERILTLEGPEEVQATEKPQDLFKVKWQDVTGKDTTITTPAPNQTPVPAATATPVPTGIDVSFQVVDKSSSSGIEGAKFTMNGSATVTVSEDSAKGGKYKSSAKVLDGTYNVTVKATDYSSVKVRKDPESGWRSRLDLGRCRRNC